ncbi:MAG: aminotransferase class V-fold PLP-dependent enzyme [Acidobacteriota bacterium]
MERREFFRRSGGIAAVGMLGQLIPGASVALVNVVSEVSHIYPLEIAQDEAFWRKIRSLYVPPTDLIDLDHANVSPTSTPVFEAFAKRARRLSHAPAERFGEMLEFTGKDIRKNLASLLGTQEDRFAMTPNSTYGLNTVLHGFPLVAGDEILVTNHEYPDMIETIMQRTRREGIVIRSVSVPTAGEDRLALVTRIKQAITPRTKLLLISHVSAWSGEILPVAEVTKAAREQGVAVLVDAAQSVGMLDVNFDQIGCDFLATSLHKWLGGPLTAGVLVMRKEHVGKVWPLHPPSWDTSQYPMDLYEWSGSINMAANASIGEAITFQQMLGSARKLSRMRYLGTHWQHKVSGDSRIEILTPPETDRSFGVASFAVKDMPSAALVRYLRKEKGILVQDKSGRYSPFANAIRVSAGPYTTPKELDGFVAALKSIVKGGLPKEYIKKTSD